MKNIVVLFGGFKRDIDKAVKLLEEKGYKHIDLGEILEEEYMSYFKEYIRVDRNVFYESIVERDGESVLMKKALEKIILSDSDDFVISGISNIGELSFMKIERVSPDSFIQSLELIYIGERMLSVLADRVLTLEDF